MSEHALMERTTGGLHVEIEWLAEMNLGRVTCSTTTSVSAPVDAAHVLDAFNHPMVYLHEAQIDALFPRA
jgi:hypothetical protein